MNDVPPGRAGSHHLQHSSQRGRFPIALRAEAVTGGHEPLNSQAGQLFEPGEILKVSVKAPKPPASRKARKPSPIRAAYRSDSRRSPPGRS